MLLSLRVSSTCLIELARTRTVPEELLTNMTLSPILIAALAGVAVVAFFIGWKAKGSGANRRESELKREILEAKGSIPQLESSVRNRDTQISRLQSDLNETSTAPLN